MCGHKRPCRRARATPSKYTDSLRNLLNPSTVAATCSLLWIPGPSTFTHLKLVPVMILTPFSSFFHPTGPHTSSDIGTLSAKISLGGGIRRLHTHGRAHPFYTAAEMNSYRFSVPTCAQTRVAWSVVRQQRLLEPATCTPTRCADAAAAVWSAQARVSRAGAGD